VILALIPSCLYPLSVSFTGDGCLALLYVSFLCLSLDARVEVAAWAVFVSWAINNSPILLYMWHENVYLDMIVDFLFGWYYCQWY
jgi:hypothetical protein